MSKNTTKTEIPATGSRWAVVIIILIVLMMISFFSALIIGIFVASADIEPQGNVAKIRIAGPITSYNPGGMWSDDFASSTDIVKLIERADEREDIQAILLEINSGGGSAVATYEIAEAVSRTNKTTVAWIREAGASGAYWVASGTDHIVANPMSITGSIGVIASYVEIGGTLERYNASYQRLVSGDYKDMGTPLRELTDDEETIMLSNLDLIREYFIDAVAENRNLARDDVEKLADGRFYLGVQAFEYGLIDELGGRQEAIAYIEKELGIEAEIAEYEQPKSFLEALAGAFNDFSFNMGRGMGSSIIEKDIKNGNVGAGLRI
jgi:protease-4